MEWTTETFQGIFVAETDEQAFKDMYATMEGHERFRLRQLPFMQEAERVGGVSQANLRIRPPATDPELLHALVPLGQPGHDRQEDADARRCRPRQCAAVVQQRPLRRRAAQAHREIDAAFRQRGDAALHRRRRRRAIRWRSTSAARRRARKPPPLPPSASATINSSLREGPKGRRSNPEHRTKPWIASLRSR